MVFSHKVMDRSGEPTVWITEDLDQDPEDHAPVTYRITWKVVRMNCGLIHVKAQHYARIFDGCANAYSRNVEEHVPEDHLEEMRIQIQLDLLDGSREQKVRFPQFDIIHTVDPTPVQESDA